MKTLIVKTGYCELLDMPSGPIVSLGDVLRSTVVLGYFKHSSIDWLTSTEAKPLLATNPHIRSVITLDEDEQSIDLNKYDQIINLEKSQWEKLEGHDQKIIGFIHQNGIVTCTDGFQEMLECSVSQEFRKKNKKSVEQMLCEALGLKWFGEGGNLASPSSEDKILFDVGINWSVGKKIPFKMWPITNWQQLFDSLQDKYRASWQEQLNNLCAYIEWISSCRILVTNDSLGLHIANALGKRVVALLGPTFEHELPKSDNIHFIINREGCLGCENDQYLSNSHTCMNNISVEEVVKNIDSLLGNDK